MPLFQVDAPETLAQRGFLQLVRGVVELAIQQPRAFEFRHVQ
jgi:hypothetical protein